MTAGRPIVIIPAFNEAAHLPKLLDDLTAIGLDCELVVVDDGSTDETAAVAARHGAHVVRHPFNLGYGNALQTGYKYALKRGAALVVQIDADGQHDPRDIPKLIAPIARGECDLVLGSRFLEPTDYHMTFAKRVGSQFFGLMARTLGLSVTDPTSGFQAINRKVLELYAGDFYPSDYPDVDVLLTAHRHGLRLGERSVNMSAGLRPSSLHGGLRSVYYAYKMLLSIWVASSINRHAAS